MEHNFNAAVTAMRLTVDNLEAVATKFKGNVKGIKLPRAQQVVVADNPFTGYEARARVGDWLVRVADGRVVMMTDEEFHETFRSFDRPRPNSGDGETYRVEWSIGSDAETPLAAAIYAKQVQLDPESLADEFVVVDCDGNRTFVDLADHKLCIACRSPSLEIRYKPVDEHVQCSCNDCGQTWEESAGDNLKAEFVGYGRLASKHPSLQNLPKSLAGEAPGLPERWGYWSEISGGFIGETYGSYQEAVDNLDLRLEVLIKRVS